MSFIIGLLTAVMVLDCLILIFLILLQLPKKEAGMGTAFGSSTTDALFGAGSGNALTVTTKYAAAIFLGLALLIPILGRLADTRSGVEKRLQQKVSTPPAVPSLPGKKDSEAKAPGLTLTNLPDATSFPVATNAVLLTNTPGAPAPITLTPAVTNQPAPPSTNVPPAK
jgi:preprotein translocase subunit SecG